MAAGLAKRLLQDIQRRRRHADVDRALSHREDVGAGSAEHCLEVLARMVVQDRPMLAALLVLGRVGVVHAVRRIGEAHVGQFTGQDLLYIGEDRGITAQDPMLTAESTGRRAG